MGGVATLDFSTCKRPDGDRAIKQLIERSIERILVDLGEGTLSAIILTGAMTQGEGTVLVHSDGAHTIMSDLDVYLVAAPGADMAALKRRASKLARVLRSEVPERDLASSFDLAAVTWADLANVEPAIGTVDLRNRGRVIWGKDVLAGLPTLDPGSIPPRDAVLLIFNRIVEQLSLSLEMGESAGEMAIYHAAKSEADLALAVLVLIGEYRPTYEGRAARLRQIWDEPVLENLRAHIPDFPDRVALCTEYKLGTDPEVLRKLTGREARHAVRMELRASLVPRVEAVWTWALQRWTGTDESDPLALADRIGRMETLRERLRGWKAAWRRGDFSPAPGAAWRAVRGIRQGSPRSLLYAATSLVYFASPGRNGCCNCQGTNDRYIRRALRLMPVRSTEKTGTEWEQAGRVLVEYWKRAVMRGMR